MKEIAADRHPMVSDMVAGIDATRTSGNLSSAIRLFVFDHYRTQAAAAAGPRSAPLGAPERS